jgi:hypothetical protein
VPGYYPPGYYPPAPTPAARRSRTVPIVLGVVGGLVALVVIGAAVLVVAFRLHGSTAAQSASTAPAFTPYTGDLAELLLPLPPGATPATFGYLTADMSDTQRVSAIWNHDQPTTMSSRLTEHNFRRSADREWTLGGSTVFLVLLQFSQPSDAASWYLWVVIHGFSGPDVEPNGGSISDSILTSRYETQKFTDGNRQQVGLAVDGQFVILVIVDTFSPQADFPTLQTVAVSQYQRLPAS